VNVNPLLLSKYDITPLEVYEAIYKSNINVGGDVIEKNGQAYVVRGIGLLQSIEDIENILIETINDVPVLVRNVASVNQARCLKSDRLDLIQMMMLLKALL
jgi:cobalt-zinc-cadmium resistance protein CzcA